MAGDQKNNMAFIEQPEWKDLKKKFAEFYAQKVSEFFTQNFSPDEYKVRKEALRLLQEWIHYLMSFEQISWEDEMKKEFEDLYHVKD